MTLYRKPFPVSFKILWKPHFQRWLRIPACGCLVHCSVNPSFCWAFWVSKGSVDVKPQVSESGRKGVNSSLQAVLPVEEGCRYQGLGVKFVLLTSVLPLLLTDDSGQFFTQIYKQVLLLSSLDREELRIWESCPYPAPQWWSWTPNVSSSRALTIASSCQGPGRRASHNGGEAGSAHQGMRW